MERNRDQLKNGSTEAAVDELALRRVLVATDFSEGAGRGLDLAIPLAKVLHARIDIVHMHPIRSETLVTPLDLAPVPLSLTPEELDQIEKGLDRLATRVREAGMECSTYHEERRAPEGILARADAIGANLIVMGTHGRTGLRRLVLGSVAEQVLRHAKCPVLVVPPERREGASRA